MDIRQPRLPVGILALLATLFLLIVPAVPTLAAARPVSHAMPNPADLTTLDIAGQREGDRSVVGQVAALPEPATVLVVKTTDDVDNGVCTPSHCSLREAINAANNHAGADTITFNIPAGNPGCTAAGVCTIQPGNPLPELRDGQTTIDGYTQPGASLNSNPIGQPINAVLKIVLDGFRIAGWPDGLQIRSLGNLVRGLVIQRFNDGISVIDASNNHIEGNFIGTNAQGTADFGNRCHGVSLSGVEGGAGSQNNVVGGSSPQARNLISGNDCVGVGTGPVGNNKVLGNYIGTTASGSAALPNNGDGVRVYNISNDNIIGGQAAGEANLIAFNIMNGVRIDGEYGAAHNTITRNRIFSNQSQGIRLAYGGNDGIAAPSIIMAGVTQVSGVACANCAVEVFSDADGQGALFEGTTTANAYGNWSFSKPGGMAGPHLTATATDSGGNTSEFSTPRSMAAHAVWLPVIMRQ